MSGEPQGPERPAGYRLVTPQGWVRIPLEPGPREQAIRRLVDRQFAGQDHLPHLRRGAIEELESQARAAHDAAGVEMYVSTMVLGPVPVTVSLVVSLVPGPETGQELDEDALEMLAQELVVGPEDADGRRRVEGADVRRLPGVGPALRSASTTTVPAAPEQVAGFDTGAFDTFGVDWFVPVPHGTGELLLLSYSSPMMPLREALEGLCDTVTATLVWT
jgi:hypothetical protein